MNPNFDYPTFLSDSLSFNKPRLHTALDLFAGCGGLALGFEAAGFDTIGYEFDEDCCKTYRQNLCGECNQIFLTPEIEFPNADIVIGGPPCQPFSVGGHQLGLNDSRDGFPTFISAVSQLQPKLFLFENVRGLLYRNKWYLDEITAKLESLGYIVDCYLVNAVNHLVPQNRERVIVVGHHGGFMAPASVARKMSAGEALGELAMQVFDESNFLTASMDEYVEKYERAQSGTDHD